MVTGEIVLQYPPARRRPHNGDRRDRLRQGHRRRRALAARRILRRGSPNGAWGESAAVGQLRGFLSGRPGHRGSRASLGDAAAVGRRRTAGCGRLRGGRSHRRVRVARRVGGRAEHGPHLAAPRRRGRPTSVAELIRLARRWRRDRRQCLIARVSHPARGRRRRGPKVQ
jgi:hypothetical protein